MRVMIFFDLPVDTGQNRREYRHFRQYLIKSGFMMLQESVYVKLVPNSFSANMVVDRIKKHKPSNGLVQVLKITEKQYGAIENIVGVPQSEIVNSDERLIVL